MEMKISKRFTIFTVLIFTLAFIVWIAGYKVQVQAQNGDKVISQLHDGLWICKTPISIHSLMQNLLTISQTGIKPTRTVIDELVQNDVDCERLDADNIKPVQSAVAASLDASWSIIRVSDGKKQGWTDLDMYVAYMQFHVVRKPEEK